MTLRDDLFDRARALRNHVLWQSNASIEHIVAALIEERRIALRDAKEAYEAHDRAGREWVRGSLYDTLNREAAARVYLLMEDAVRDGGGND